MAAPIEFNPASKIWHVQYETPVFAGVDKETGTRRYASVVPPLDSEGLTHAEAAKHAAFVGGTVFPYRPTEPIKNS